MSSIARVLDCDGTLTELSDGTLLERFMHDFYKEQSLIKKTNLFLGSIFIRGYSLFAKALRKFSDEQEITGETNSLKLFDLLMLRKAKIHVSFLEERAKEYAELLKPEHIAAIKKCEDDIYIVSAEPKQLLEAIIKYAGLSEHISGIYGTKFEISKDRIKKLNRSELVVGMPGKHIGMADIVSNGYSKIFAIGDSHADIGLFKMYRKKVVPYTFYGAAPELVEYVTKNNGKLVKNLEEFFECN